MNNPAKNAKYVRTHHERRRALTASIKDVPCADCGNRYPAECMDFDHRDGEVKLLNIAMSPSISTARLLAEIEKCDIVCANCHRVRTRLRRPITHPRKDGTVAPYC